LNFYRIEKIMKLKNILYSNRGTLLLIGAGGFAILAVFAAKNYLGQQVALEKARLQPNQAMVDVVVAKADLPRGSLIEASTMAVRSIPKAYAVSGSVDPDRFESYLGSKIALPMRAGEPLIAQSIEGADIATFSAKVKTGIRAMTVVVDEVNSVSGMLQPGDRVDLLLSVKPPAVTLNSPPAPEVTAALMQDVAVLATGKQVRPGQGDNPQARTFATITIEVSPDAAQKLVVAQRSGKLTALLRNPGDRTPMSQAPLDLYGLLQISPHRQIPQQVAAGPELIVGGKGTITVNGQQNQALKVDAKETK
jgi:pilus assembly protein CpaB